MFLLPQNTQSLSHRARYGVRAYFFDFYLVILKFIRIFAASTNKCIWIMETKKVTYEEALARFKRSLEIKRNAEKRMAEEWKAMGLKGTIVSL